ncbi:MAG TPA: aspartate aminotransferase family protein [Kofleriaceae bacterium]|nr:aspartate aminotransferase family protein [Kofleriaceae bacterium]
MTQNPPKSSAESLLSRDAANVVRPWSGTGEPVPIVWAEDVTIRDAGGQEFIDFTSGYFVNNAGHRHPRVMDAAKAQLDKVTQVSGRHTTEAVVDLAEKLVQLTPRSLDKVFFTTGGSEANEFALKMARQHTKRPRIACLDNGFHGLSLGALAACANQKYRDSAGVPLGDHVYMLPTPYCYRCPHQQNCDTQCLDDAEKALDEHPDTAALLAEPVQAVGGIIPSQKWWKRADDIRKKRGLLLILDEIQSGVGRTGKMFAAEHYGLAPDILTAGKGLSGGVGSLGATIASDEVVDGFFGGTTPTSAGNAVSAAAGYALIEVLHDEGLIENCAAMGQYFSEALADLDDPWIGDIRFLGLLGGAELVLDRETREPLPKTAVLKVKDEVQARGMLITVSGPLGNCLRLQPPLSITRQHIDAFVAALRPALAGVRAAH